MVPEMVTGGSERTTSGGAKHQVKRGGAMVGTWVLSGTQVEYGMLGGVFKRLGPLMTSF